MAKLAKPIKLSFYSEGAVYARQERLNHSDVFSEITARRKLAKTLLLDRR